MNDAIFWLNVNVALTGLLWLPYVLDRLVKQGLGAAGYRDDLPEVSQWAVRAKKAHANAIENLVIFAPSVIAYMMLAGAQFDAIQCSIEIYFFARIAHYLCYTFKIPYLRTAAFLASWGATMYIISIIWILAA